MDRIKAIDEIQVGETKHIVLEIQEGKYKGCQYCYGEMKFADKENDDGSLNMSFDYEITNGFKIDDEKEFGTYIGETLTMILEEQIKNNEVVYKGGV